MNKANPLSPQEEPADDCNMLHEVSKTGLDKVTDARNDLVAMYVPDLAYSDMRDCIVMVFDILTQVLIEHFPFMSESSAPKVVDSKEGPVRKMITFTDGSIAFDGRIWMEGKGWQYVQRSQSSPCEHGVHPEDCGECHSYQDPADDKVEEQDGEQELGELYGESESYEEAATAWIGMLHPKTAPTYRAAAIQCDMNYRHAVDDLRRALTENERLKSAKSMDSLSPSEPTAESSLHIAARQLVETMETCHICKGLLVLQENPAHCEDCSWDCEGHEGPECVPIYELHRRLKSFLAKGSPSEEGT